MEGYEEDVSGGINEKELTAFDGEDGDVVHGVDLPVQRLGRTDDAARRLNVEEALQIRVPVDGVPEVSRESRVMIFQIK